MPPHNIPFQFYQSPLSQMPVTAAGNIAFDRMGCVIPADTTDGAMTLVLAVPTKAGIIGMVVLAVDNGDLTLTVTDGYNADGDTSITFADAKDFVTFQSIETTAGNYYWRVLGQEGTNVTVEEGIFDTLRVTTLTVPGDATIAQLAVTGVTDLRDSAIAAEHADGVIATYAPVTRRWTQNGVIITEIEIDLSGLTSDGTATHVIGLADPGTDAAYLGKNVIATNGYIYKVEVQCLEVPASGEPDILFVQGSAADETYGDTVANTATIADSAGPWALGEIITLTTGITENYYYYMEAGDSDSAAYSAGKFVFRTYGRTAFALTAE